MLIKKKSISKDIIKNLGLNRVEEQVFYKNNICKVKDYLRGSADVLYNVRDMREAGGGNFLYGLTPGQVINEVVKYEKFTLFECLQELDKNNLILQGEIFLTDDCKLWASLSSIKGLSNRKAMENPEFTLDLDLLYDRIPKIRGLDKIMDYIFINYIFNVVVEFSLYDVPVGINKENVLIWELRNY